MVPVEVQAFVNWQGTKGRRGTKFWAETRLNKQLCEKGRTKSDRTQDMTSSLPAARLSVWLAYRGCMPIPIGGEVVQLRWKK
jgi:hypothetical protein